MADQNNKPSGPDLTQGVPLSDIADGGMLLGHVGGDEVLLARRGGEVFAVSAHCSHYHGPLAEGLLVGDTVRCPWHHACFSLRTGEPVHPPALSPIDAGRSSIAATMSWSRTSTRRSRSHGPSQWSQRPRRS